MENKNQELEIQLQDAVWQKTVASLSKKLMQLEYDNAVLQTQLEYQLSQKEAEAEVE